MDRRLVIFRAFVTDKRRGKWWVFARALDMAAPAGGGVSTAWRCVDPCCPSMREAEAACRAYGRLTQGAARALFEALPEDPGWGTGDVPRGFYVRQRKPREVVA